MTRRVAGSFVVVGDDLERVLQGLADLVAAIRLLEELDCRVHDVKSGRRAFGGAAQ